MEELKIVVFKVSCFLNTSYSIQLRDDSDGDNMHHCGFLFCVLQIGNLGVCAWVILPATNGKILICACNNTCIILLLLV